MSAKTGCLAMRLESPLQSWGTSSRQNERRTDAHPSRSALCGMFCAALGYDRGSTEEQDFLRHCARLRLMVTALPRHAVGHLRDFQTVEGSLRATGAIKPTHLITRYYLHDAVFFAFLSGERDILERIAAALQDPVWGIWLGRKNCIPSAPVFAGLYADETTARQACLPDAPESLRCVRDADSMGAGVETVNDVPVSFAFGQRQYQSRLVVDNMLFGA